MNIVVTPQGEEKMPLLPSGHLLLSDKCSLFFNVISLYACDMYITYMCVFLHFFLEDCITLLFPHKPGFWWNHAYDCSKHAPDCMNDVESICFFDKCHNV